MQTEYLYPSVGDRRSPNEWQEQGALDASTRAMVKVAEILASHYPTHIPEAVDAEIRSRFPIRLARSDMQPAGAGPVVAPRAARA